MDKLGYEVEKLLHHLEPVGLDGHHLEGTFALSNYTFYLVIALFLTLLFFVFAARKASLVPKGFGNLAETGVEFVRNSIVSDVMGPEGLKYLPFMVTVFFFVLFNNLLGLVPGGLPGTGTVGTTFTWGLFVFLTYNFIGFQKNGIAYLKSFIPSGTPWWLQPLILLLEVVSHLLRPFTLGVRLYANMYAGHIILGVFVIFIKIVFDQITAGGLVVASLSFVMLILMYAFELFVAFIQAYVFTILTAVYISGALHAADH